MAVEGGERKLAIRRVSDIREPAQQGRNTVHRQYGKPQEEEKDFDRGVVVVHALDAEEEEQEGGWHGQDVDGLEGPDVGAVA